MHRRSVLLSGVGLLALPAIGSASEQQGGRKVLVVSFGQPIPVLDPHVRYDAPTRMMQQALYDALVKYEGEPARVTPWLAERWEVSADGKDWTFHLVGNARFHNGDPVDAEAVRYSFRRGLMLNKGVAWMLKGCLDSDGIETVDSRTIRFKLKRPYPAFVSFLPMWFIVNPRQVEAHVVDGDSGQKWLTENEAGSGPFRIARWDPNTLMQLDAVADYWRGWPMGEANRLGGVIFRVIREPAGRKAAVQRGEVDITGELTPEDYELLAKARGLAVERHTGFRNLSIMMNNGKGPTANAEFRKAIASALDYDSLIAIENGAAKQMTSPFQVGLNYHVDVETPKQDLTKAKEHLARTPWPNGGVELEYVYVQGTEDTRRIGLAVLNALQRLNIKVNVVAQPWPTVLARGAKPETTPDLVSIYIGAVSNDPEAVAMQYHPSASGQYWGMHHYNNPSVGEMILMAGAEDDTARRSALYADVQKGIMADQPCIFAFVGDQVWVRRDNVRGFAFTPTRIGMELDLYQLWVA